MKLPTSLIDFTGTVNAADTAVIGLGNRDRADDGFGLRLAAQLKTGFPTQVFSEADRNVENIVIDLVEEMKFSVFLFIDAADFGGSPGELKLFGPEDTKRFTPSFSTHKVPITFLMDIIIAHGGAPYLLAVQPYSLEMFGIMSPEVAGIVSRLTALLNQFFLPEFP